MQLNETSDARQLALDVIDDLRLNFGEESLVRLKGYIERLYIDRSIDAITYDALCKRHSSLMKSLLTYHKFKIMKGNSYKNKECKNTYKYRPLWLKNMLSSLSNDISITYSGDLYCELRNYIVKVFGIEFKFSYAIDKDYYALLAMSIRIGLTLASMEAWIKNPSVML